MVEFGQGQNILISGTFLATSGGEGLRILWSMHNSFEKDIKPSLKIYL